MRKHVNDNWCEICDNPRGCCTCPKTKEIKRW